MTSYEIEVLNNHPITDITYEFPKYAMVKTEKLSIKISNPQHAEIILDSIQPYDKIKSHNREKLKEALRILKRWVEIRNDTSCTLQ